MNMKSRRILALLLCAVLALSVMTSCKNGSKVSSGSSSAAGDADSEPDSTGEDPNQENPESGDVTDSGDGTSNGGGTTAPGASTKPGQGGSTAPGDTTYWANVTNFNEAFGGLKFDAKTVDLKGKTVTIAEWEPISRKVRGAKDLSQTEKEYYWQVEHIEKLFNCKIEFKNCGAYNIYLENLVKSSASETPYVDLAVGRMGEISQLTKNGYFRSIDSFVDYASANFAPAKEFSKFLDNKHYGVMLGIPSPYVCMYNPKLIKDSGATDPMTYYQQGKWNMDAFEEIARKCTNLTGATKKYGIGGHSATNIGKSLFYAENLPLVYAKDGKYQCNLFTDKGKAILEYYQKLAFTDKIVHCPFDDAKNPITSYAQFKNGNVAMMIVPQWEPKTSMYDSGFKAFSVVPMPMGKTNKTFVTVTDTCMIRALPITSKLSEKEFLAVMMALYGLMGGPGPGVKFKDSRLDKSYSANKYQNFEKQMLEQNHWRTALEIKTYYDAYQKAPITVDYFNLDPTTIEPYFNQTFERIERGDSITSMLTEIKSELEGRIAKYNLK